METGKLSKPSVEPTLGTLPSGRLSGTKVHSINQGSADTDAAGQESQASCAV